MIGSQKIEQMKMKIEAIADQGGGKVAQERKYKYNLLGGSCVSNIYMT